ncbi:MULTISPECIES: peptide chain release factor N(5)-glutamine methyltransferase [Tsukamurella]|uniref:Release factor glutamine methyltransferase n=2 Tax=Tsukamurella TaxID=2060 RepID=A0A5C5S3Q5_9ACTN|nr:MULTISPECIES: peptide chain release factor N(5)-glutamine methyltransferase [Tsukamurella]NMD56408.1 peptide chain release factor N(5)-glutamine methyltransferase [Tsukamurella columbiensis]TWS29243.1 peptide chain release factor N(5)-glutamine methyltransferase [Tsukamurella conjunctivitidis]
MSLRPTHLAAAAAARLAAAGVPSARFDAETLLAEALGIDRGRIPIADDATPAQEAAYEALLARREAREPLQHILGRAYFGPLTLAVGPGVFVPRPETELLAAWAAQQVDGGAGDMWPARSAPGAGAMRPARSAPGAGIVDLCAGSGALGLYLAATVPDARVVLVERDETALDYLRRNVAGADLAGRATVLAADVREPDLPERLAALLGTVDLVVSNPPYVPDDAPLDHEAAADPAAALFSGADGLDLIRGLAPLAARLLAGGGAVGIEHDDGNGAGTADLLRAAGFGDLVQHRDLAGRPRYVTGRMDP